MTGLILKMDKNNEPYVFSIEDGEWLLYTLTVEKQGNYLLSFNTSGADGIISVYNNDKIIVRNISIRDSGEPEKFITSSPQKIYLNKGVNKLKIYFEKGGFDFKDFQLSLNK